MIPFRRLRPLVAVVTAFTVAHSITLIASAFDMAPTALWFPPLIETLIAASIVYMALENIIGAQLERRWIVTFGFGLVHGFGFSFALRESLQFAGSHLLTSLLAFNVGVELGQLLVLLVLLPVLAWVLGRVVNERMGTIILSALVAHTAWHWLVERWAVLARFQWQWPDFDVASAVVPALGDAGRAGAYLPPGSSAPPSPRLRPPRQRRRPHAHRFEDASRAHGRAGLRRDYTCQMRQVVVACASSLPAASSRRPSAIAVRRPRCSTVPMPRSGPVATVMGFR